MAISLLATADTHLGKPPGALAGVPSPDRYSTRHTWRQLIRLALDRNVEAVLLAGDIVDAGNRYFESVGLLRDGIRELAGGGIVTYAVAGNHDADVLGELARQLPTSHFRLLGKGGRWEKQIHQTSDGRQLQLAGWSFPTAHVSYDPVEQFDISIDASHPSIGLLHADLQDPESRYAPASLQRLTGTGVQAWVLGHIHKPQVLREQAPLVCYPGSPHALDPSESGPHGPVLLQVQSERSVSYEWQALSPVRYEELEFTLQSDEDPEQISGRIYDTVREWLERQGGNLSPAQLLVVDLVCHGPATAYPALQQVAGEDGPTFEMPDCLVSIRKTVDRTHPDVGDLQALSQQKNPAGILAKLLIEIEQQQGPFHEQMVDRTRQMIRSVNRHTTYRPLQESQRILDDHDPQAVRNHLAQVARQLLVELVRQKEEGS